MLTTVLLKQNTGQDTNMTHDKQGTGNHLQFQKYKYDANAVIDTIVWYYWSFFTTTCYSVLQVIKMGLLCYKVWLSFRPGI